MNSGELPIWANNICRWLAYQEVIKDQLQREKDTQERIDAMSRWQKFIHGYPRPNYAPDFFLNNPFPMPTSKDLVKFRIEYPDMAKEWLS